MIGTGWASNGVKKFAFIGTSCSGKTTLCLSALAQLKTMGVSCDGVLQQDRRFAFDRDQLEQYKEAQYYFICNQVMRETELTLRGHAEVLISDRSVLDLYAYYVAQYGHDDGLFQLVWSWMETYTTLYHLDPLPYVDDKSRPSDEFRLQVDECLDKMIRGFGGTDRIKRLPRKEIMTDILQKVGKLLTEVDLAIIPATLEVNAVLIGGSYAFNRATKWSDVDVYVRHDDLAAMPTTIERALKEQMSARLNSVLGVKADIHLINYEVWQYLYRQGFRRIERDK